MIGDAGGHHVLPEQICDVITGAQDVGDDQLEVQGSCDIAYRLRHIDSGVIRLGEQQRNDNCRCLAGLGQLFDCRIQIRLCQVQICRNSSDLCLLGNGRHEPLDGIAALGMPTAFRRSSARERACFLDTSSWRRIASAS